jgi:competence protein ComEA
MKLWQTISIAVLTGLLAAGLILLIASPPIGEPIELLPTRTESPIWIHIEGSVCNPGLLSLPKDARVQDAIDQAGGACEQADLSKVNLAQVIVDGQKITIPFVTDQQTTIITNSSIENIDASMEKININTASEFELQLLPGIGPSKALDIIEYRNSNGLFASIEDLIEVRGIGEATLDSIRDLIKIDP